MTTYGPFYPSSLVNESQGGSPWTISGGVASASISGEGVTDFLKATGFSANVPTGATILQARLELSQTPQSQGLDISEQYTINGPGDAYNLGNSGVYSEDPGLTPAVVNDSGFGFKFSIYAPSGGTLALSSLALYIDVE